MSRPTREELRLVEKLTDLHARYQQREIEYRAEASDKAIELAQKVDDGFAKAIRSLEQWQSNLIGKVSMIGGGVLVVTAGMQIIGYIFPRH